MGTNLTQIMDPYHQRDEQDLIDALPPPHDGLRYVLHGTLMLSYRACSAIVSPGAPRTFIRAGFARGVGFHSVPRPGELGQRLDGSWRPTIEHFYPTLRLAISGISWRVRAIEGGTGPFDLVLGADWLHYHRVVVDIYAQTLTLGAPGGRVVLQFVGAPAVLTITGFIHDPPAAPVAPPALESEPEEEPEEDKDDLVIL